MIKIFWYHKAGFKKNPFSIKPTAELVGVDRELAELKKNIATGAIYLLMGEYGTGKTAVLKNLIREFKGRKRIIFYSYNRREKSLDLDKLLYGRSIYSKIFRIKPKNMILLLDEVSGLNMKERRDLIHYYNKGNLKSIVLVAKNKGDFSLGKELESLVGENVLKLGNLTPDQAVKMIRKRIGSLRFLSDKMIRKIHSINKNTRTFLENCEDVCRYAFECNSKSVKEEHLKVLNNQKT
ncbi:MAG: ATP-binding protein [Nanoarchaeota archaeon]|nr:ATP-binding protein [Nanoarchaeota archaeon]MBU1269261.1 ATP-binding protein [Nanoarchaeota archaeon]MBU1604210.1 ATP-binding protein [Nanoarchaeota archaeon]MBU2443274.1 ATP-binding protein [Nanoarchaeota archaeon]